MRKLLFFALGSGLAVGCGGGGNAMPDADDLAPYNCAAETRADVFSLGLEKLGANGLFNFKLMTATPAPPARGDNDWVIEIDSTGASAAPMPGLGSDIKVVPYMPDHQHGTPVKIFVDATATDGQYDLAPVNLWMPGLWQTTISVDAGGMKDSAVFAFCLST